MQLPLARNKSHLQGGIDVTEATYVIFNFLEAALQKNWKEANKIIFNKYINSIQNIFISICNQYENV